MTVQYSIQKMVSDGTLSTIALGIQYLQRNDIYIRIAGEETPQSGASSGYTWSFLDNTTLKILPVVPNGIEVVVYRRTDVDAMYNIYSQNAQFDEATIDENNQQLLYIAQEYLEQGLPGTGVDTIEYVRDDGSFTYYRMRRTDGSYSEEFTVPSASNSTKVLTREALRRSYAEAGYNLVDGSFEAGGTLVDANDVLLHEASGKAFSGPAGTVAAGTNPASGGFVDRSNELSDENRGFLPTKYSSQWGEPLSGATYPQALAESENYYFITEDDGTGSPYNSKIYRINKSTGVKSAGSPYIASRGQGIGVISDDVVFIGGSTDSKIATYSFVTGLVTETACTGLYKNFPFCYDKDSDSIYQLQDANATSDSIVKLSILDRVNGFLGDTNIPLMMVKGGYPQGLSYSGGQLYVTCGGEWLSSTGGAWNDYWTMYKISPGGVVLDYMSFKRSSMGAPLGLPSLTRHKPQGISIRDGKISLLQLFGSGSSVIKSIYKEDQAGLLVRSMPRNRFHSYNGLDDIGINIATLSAGSAISTIVAGMSDGTSLTFSFSNEAWVSNDIGFQFGVCTVIRTNGFIAYAIAVESSSSITANITPRAAIISVFRTTQSSPKLIVGESNTLSVGYTGPGSPVVAGPITISNASLANNMMFHVSESASGSSFVSKFSRAEINGYISRGAKVTLTANLSGIIEMTFTAGGVNISSVSGTAYLRYVFTN